MYAETITLTDHPKYRFQVVQDVGASSPIEGVEPAITAHCVASGYGSITKSDDDLTRAYLRFTEYLDEYHAFDVFQRYLKIFHGWTDDQINERVELYEHRGYMQSDWATVLFIVHDEGYGDVQGWAEEWDQWARGDVYGVIAEKRIECESSECHGDEDNHYEEVDSLCGIYANDAEEAATYFATDHL